MMNLKIMKKVAAILDCPSCGKQSLKAKTGNMACAECGATFPAEGGFIDLEGETGRAATRSQRMMEYGPIVRVYEGLWRPLITMAVSSYRWEKKRVDRFMEFSRGMTVMDLACGTGAHARRFSRAAGDEGFVVGVDLSRPMLKQAAAYIGRDGINNTALIRANVLKCPLLKGRFDRIHCSGALHLFNNMPDVMSRLHGWLKPGGLFVGCTYLLGQGEARRRRKLESGKRMGFHWFEPEELEQLAKNAGFSDYRAETYREGIVFKAVG